MTLPLWGNPWHGKLRENFLELPGGGTKFIAQPLPSRVGTNPADILRESYGRTVRIALNGVDPVVRTPDELAADSAAGYRWQHVAVLAGGRAQLSGKVLDGWIYQDPAGVRWWVRCAQITEAANFNPSAPVSLAWTLTRFGDIGRPFEQYTYNLSLTDWGLDYPGVAPTTVKLVIDDVRHDGSAAVLMVHQRRASEFNLDERRAYSFHEISIAGLGHEAVFSITKVASNAQVLTTASEIPPAPLLVVGYYRLRDEDDNEVIPWEWRVWEGQYGDPGLPPSAGDVTVGLEDFDTRIQGNQNGSGWFEAIRVVAMWYSAGGSLLPVVLKARQDFEIYNQYPAPNNEYSTSITWTYRVEFNGLHSPTVSGSHITLGEQSFIRGATQSFTETVTSVSDGFASSTVIAETAYNDALRFSGYNQLTDQQYLYAVTGAIRRNGVGLSMTGLGGHELARFANHVIGPIVFRAHADPFTAGGGYAMHPPLTPSGPASGTARVTASQGLLANYRYGSWDPHTNQTTWGDTAPVCYI